jgi:hypothetical protein
VNLNLGNEISDALDEMCPPLGNSKEYAMTHLSQFQGDAGSAYGDCSDGPDNEMIVPHNDFSAGDLDEDYDKEPAAKSIGGVFSPKREALLILQRFSTQQATLTSLLFFCNTTVQRAYFTPSDEDGDDFIPDKGYDDDDLFQDDKEEDLKDLSHYRTTRRRLSYHH